MSKLIVGNWKMNGTITLVDAFLDFVNEDNVVIGFPTLFISSSTTNSFFFKMFFSYRALFKSYFMISFSYFKCWSLTLKISTEFISSEHWCRRLSFSIIPFHKTMFRLQSCSFNSKFYPSRSRTTLANCSTSNLWFWSILWKLFMSIITVFNFQA